MTNTLVGMKISIQKELNFWPPIYQNVYVETQNATTNDNGLVSIRIGDGAVVEGVFADIDWSNGKYFIKTETDPAGGTNYTISGSSQILSVPYALYAEYAENTKKYKVGDFAHGGIVFWVDETGQHGLVCAKEDQSTAMRWYAGTYGNTQAKGDGPYAGKTNTSIIIAAQVAIGDDGNTYAARLCNELLITEGGKQYGDWYLPSRHELILMSINKEAINATATANGGSAFANDVYWSSTESSDTYALKVNLANAITSYKLKNSTGYVRAVRAF